MYKYKKLSALLLMTCALLYSSAGLAKGFWKNCPEAQLSPEQKTLIKENRIMFKNRKRDLSKEERRQARKELKKDMLDNILTSDTQREAVQACWDARKNHRRSNRNKGNQRSNQRSNRSEGNQISDRSEGNQR